MFRRNFKIAADMMGNQFLDIFRRFNGQIVAQAGSDKDFFVFGIIIFVSLKNS